jgi:hypothetical protein
MKRKLGLTEISSDNDYNAYWRLVCGIKYEAGEEGVQPQK